VDGKINQLDVLIMKAAVYLGKEQLVVQDVTNPSLEDGEVLLKIHACSVCGTDLRTYRHGDKKIIPPRVLGHEFCATVLESRAPEANVKVGDRVVMYIVIVSESDRYVEMGRENLTAHRTTISYHHDGAFASFMKVPAIAVKQGNLFKVTSDITNEHMSLAEPLGCCMNAHSRLGIGLKDTVAVIGAGPIGMMHATLARLQGARRSSCSTTIPLASRWQSASTLMPRCLCSLMAHTVTRYAISPTASAQMSLSSPSALLRRRTTPSKSPPKRGA
jgi:L-iditol 2-dehydrogenase